MTSSSRARGSLAAADAFTAWTPDELALAPGDTTDIVGADLALVEAAPRSDPHEAERLLQEQLHDAYVRGYDEGAAAAQADATAQLADAFRTAQRAIDEVRQGAKRWTDNTEENLCALAVAVARQVVEREVTTAPDVVQALVRRALSEFPADQPLAVRVNPTDHALLTAGDAELGARRETTWLADPSIERGGCLVEGRDRIIDGRVDTALERLYRTLSATDA